MREGESRFEEQSPETQEKSEKEISPEFVEKVENSVFNVDDKVNILLVKSGLRSAASISFNARVWGYGKDERYVSEKESQKAARMIENSGLAYRRASNPENIHILPQPDGTDIPYNHEHVSFLIARTPDDLSRIALAVDSKDDELMGKAFGFPETAVKAYLEKGKVLDINKLPKKIKEGAPMAFCHFALSEENWKEEIKQGQIWGDFIKKTSPKIYKEMVALNKKQK